MLHELFLVLAGHTSPLFNPILPWSFPLLSPSERAILNKIAKLGHLHRSLKDHCAIVTVSHPSTIARATASRIAIHVQKFRAKVSELEKLILRRDDSVVGAYNIVPLARIVAWFSGWDRVLGYFDEVIRLIIFGRGGDTRKNLDENDEKQETAELTKIMAEKGLGGAKLIDTLREDIQTGYPSIEEVAMDLLRAAETAWLLQVSTWVLYGRLPAFGAKDFMVREVAELDEAETKSYVLSRSNTPRFVLAKTASSIHFVGRALLQIRSRDGSSSRVNDLTAMPASGTSLLQNHLAYLQSLKTPLSPILLNSAIMQIRESLSRNVLQNLLPSSQVIETVVLLREYYLLGRGEFAINLINQADEKARGRWKKRPGMTGPQNLLANVAVKEGEVSGVLKRTWATLSTLQSEEDHDELLDKARELLYLSLKKPPAAGAGSTVKKKREEPEEKTLFNDVLLGVSINLNFILTWPLDLFLSQQDLDIYESLFHYLLSIRRAQVRLQSLWQSRRNALLLGLATRERKDELRQNRIALIQREKQQRAAWATGSLAVFFLESLGVYFQSNVIGMAYDELQESLAATVAEIVEKKKAKEEEQELSKEKKLGSPLHSPTIRPRSSASNVLKTPSSPSRRPLSMTTRTPISSPSKHAHKYSFPSPFKHKPVPNSNSRPSTPSSPHRPATPTHPAKTMSPKADASPEKLALAHQEFLQYIFHHVFLTDDKFLELLRKFLFSCDALVARISALKRSNDELDLTGEDNRRYEEDSEAMDKLCKEIRTLLGKLVKRLHEMDDERSSEDAPRKRKGKEEELQLDKRMLHGAMGSKLGGAGIDKLLMVLDFSRLDLGENLPSVTPWQPKTVKLYSVEQT